MRIRTIKPEFWTSESIGRVSRNARLLFIGLWSLADDSGRTRAASRMLASVLFPFDDDAVGGISEWLGELEQEGMIRRYTHLGNSYLDIPKWCDHQKIDKPSKSKIPAFAEASRGLAESSRKIALEQGTGNREQGSESVLASLASAHASDSESNHDDEEQTDDSGPSCDSEIAGVVQSTPGQSDCSLAPVPQEIRPSEKRAPARRFSPPTLEEVTAECLARDFAADPRAFWDFYESKGWKVGKAPMVSWRAALSQWNRRHVEEGRPDFRRVNARGKGVDVLHVCQSCGKSKEIATGRPPTAYGCSCGGRYAMREGAA